MRRAYHNETGTASPPAAGRIETRCLRQNVDKQSEHYMNINLNEPINHMPPTGVSTFSQNPPTAIIPPQYPGTVGVSTKQTEAALSKHELILMILVAGIILAGTWGVTR